MNIGALSQSDVDIPMSQPLAAVDNDTEKGLGDITTASTPGGKLGKEEFLQLLAEQMRNQDPLNPADSSQMIAELAQFSSLEQMQNLNEKFADYQGDTAKSEALMLTAMYGGKDVKLFFKDGTTQKGEVIKFWVDDAGETWVLMGTKSYKVSDMTGLRMPFEGEEW